MSSAYVSVGSNIDRVRSLRNGVEAMQRCFGKLILSSVYESDAEGFEGDRFYNLVVRFNANDIDEVEQVLHRIEMDNGRAREAEKFSSRTLDLDLLLFGDAVLAGQGIYVPRKEITHYAFVLWPLAELAPELKHPISGKTYRQLWGEFRHAHPRKLETIWPIEFDW